ncbi:RNA polymerase sigma factor [Pelomonas sp. P7]|uniref:RNA polymerase sigma factor n=1 Tax=Pelomonas caseinilytica TaxID=2906763 RepID=A0ABS8XI97_9BURK|nr:RNA polymerase sigma factor [Pelomonas sp. P7]MCE4540572.1 RNA polymerase sigma factor [Pelomonas sp. P7]
MKAPRVDRWQEIFARVRGALKRRGRNSHDADDLVQEAWVRLACYEKDQVVQQPEAFLMRAALNLSIDAHRAQLTHGEEVLVEDVVIIDVSPPADALVLARERMARLSEGMSRLTETTRSVFLAHRVEGQTYAEIARDLGITISAVQKHVAKATLQLTAWMDGW